MLQAVPVIDFLVDHGTAAIVMGLVQGPTLEAVMGSEKPGPWPVADALSVARDVTSALAYAHERRVIH